jgi:hypothetical protein
MAARWTYGGKRYFHPSHWSKGGFTQHAVFVPHDNGPWEAVWATTEEQARQLICAVNSHDALIKALGKAAYWMRRAQPYPDGSSDAISWANAADYVDTAIARATGK